MNEINTKKMKKSENEKYEERYQFDLEHYFVDINNVPKIDKKFVRDFVYHNNIEGKNCIVIYTNETELSFFVNYIINSYKTYLRGRGYRDLP